MKRESYEKLFSGLGRAGISPKVLDGIGKAITACTAAAYLYVLLCSFFTAEWRQLAVLTLVPAISFLICSFIRTILHAKRPYEVYGFTPLVAKDTKERSFPSRHVFSVFVIGTCIIRVNMRLGVVMISFGVVLAIIRVCIGVHFPRDVVFGALFGVMCGLVVGVLI